MPVEYAGIGVASFLASLFVSAVWLIACRAIPALRAKPRTAYGVGMSLAFVPAILMAPLSSSISASLALFAGAIVCAALVFGSRRW